MKKIYLLKTIYTNGTEEYNCASDKKEEVLKMRGYIKSINELGELKYKRSEILETEVEDNSYIVNVDGEELILI